jgi:pyruvate/2-oxoglutarate dehydrogenase complex dihydrolipoamide dehydrogenase (E3) component
MTNPRKYDAIIIGSGQAATPLSTVLAEAGLRTILIERTHVGGTCINEGCTPTKTMVASGRVAYLARRALDFGVHTGTVSVDLQKVRQRKRDVVDSFRNGSQAKIERTANLTLLFGEAKFAGPKLVEVAAKDGTTQFFTAKNIFINVGTRAARPKLDGLDDVPFLDNASIMELSKVPEHLLVLGGGYIGLEFGQLFRRLGSRVTIIQSGGQLLNNEDSDVASEVTKILRQDGIDVLLNAKALRVKQVNADIELEVQLKGRSSALLGSHLLVATGRQPNCDTLNLSATKIRRDTRGFIKVDSRLRTTVPGIYALGDIKGGPAFTHISYDDFRIIRDNLIRKKSRTTTNRPIPYTVFIDPQLGRIGITEREARAQKRQIQVAKMPMSAVARAIETDEKRGFMKAIVDRKTKRILGAAVLGIDGGEVMAVIEVAMMGKLSYTALRDGIFAHPTLAESLNNLFTAMDKK